MIGIRRLMSPGVPVDVDWVQGLVGALITLGLLAVVPNHALPVALAVLVGVVGMPHGGVDHLTGSALLKPIAPRYWPLVFATGYMVVMAVVVAGWIWFPLLILVGFVLLSAVHFGMADNSPHMAGGLALTMLEGSMVVWVPALFHPAEFARLLIWVVPGNRWPENILFDPSLQAALWLALGIVVARATATSVYTAIRVIGFAILFAIAPPLVSFAVYFCGWHSIVELTRLARQANMTDPVAGFVRVAVVTAPLSGLAVLLAVIGWLLVSADGPPTPGIVQAVFMGLSVVAVPHMLLHLVTVQQNVNPFAAEGSR